MDPRYRHSGVDSPDETRLRTDGGQEDSEPEQGADSGGVGSDDRDEGPDDGDETDDPDATPSGLDRSNVEIHEAGEAEPADPKWEKPAPEEIPEFETGAEEPLARPAGTTDGAETDGETAEDPTAGMPNNARSPGNTRINRGGTEGYVAALELCARLPEEARLPEQAADLVPAAVEAELEQDVQAFAAAEFDEHSPTVDVLEFRERDGEIWLRIRLGVPEDVLADLDPEAIRAHALEELEGVL